MGVLVAMVAITLLAIVVVTIKVVIFQPTVRCWICLSLVAFFNAFYHEIILKLNSSQLALPHYFVFSPMTPLQHSNLSYKQRTPKSNTLAMASFLVRGKSFES